MSGGVAFAAEGCADGYCGACGMDPCACARLAGLDEAAPAPPADAPLPRMVELGEAMNALHGPAIRAFADRRVEQLMAHGHSLAADAAAPRDALVRKALDRVRDAAGLLSGDLNADRLASARTKIEVAGALLLAAHDRIGNEMPAVAGGGDGGRDVGGRTSAGTTAGESAGSVR